MFVTWPHQGVCSWTVFVFGVALGACSASHDGGNRPIAVRMGEAHSCSLFNDGSIKCWGANNFGMLGYGDTTMRVPYEDASGFLAFASVPIDLGAGRTATELTAGSTHTCAVLDDGSVKCWGGNDRGQLGYGDTEGRLAPPPTAINLGAGRTATSIAAGRRHTCAILDDGTVKCWGSNSWGQLGYGDTMERDAPASAPINLGEGRTATAIEAGRHHVCALLDDATVKCWGGNDSGQLGYGDTAQRLEPASAPVDLGAGRTATAIAAEGSSTCALLDDATVKCWGLNMQSQLGYGDELDRLEPAAMPIDLGAGRTATAIAAGAFNACALLDDETVKCWGNNYDSSRPLDL